MKEQLRQLRNQPFMLAAGGLLLSGFILVFAAAALFISTRDQNEDQVQTIPLIIDSPGGGTASTGVSGFAETVQTIGFDIVDEGEGRLVIRLSKGQSQPETAEGLNFLQGEPLTDEEVRQLLERLPELLADPKDKIDFRLPPQTLPPPRTGETIDEPFPPTSETSAAPEVIEGPLEVLRFGPEGELPLAPFVNVTFNHPMVPLGTLKALDKEDIPVQIEPDLPGTWTWVSTKSLKFTFDSDSIDRLPMATEYQATVPAGTESASGSILRDPVSWSFSTPPPEMVNHYPGSSPQPLDPLFFISFNQQIDPDSVLAAIQVTSDGSPVSVRLAGDADLESDEIVNRLIENSLDGRWLAFKAVQKLPTDSNISVTIGPGTPSAEGPLVTQAADQFGFQTYAPLKIEDFGCSFWDDRCPPLSNFYIDFNNPIDVEKYDESMLTIVPELPGASVSIFGDTITIKGATEGRTTYKVTVSGDIQDQFGQALGREQTLTYRVGSADPILVGPDANFITLDPAADDPVFSVYTINYNRLHVQVYEVVPSEWPDFKNYLQEYYRQDSQDDPPGRLLFDENLPIESAADKLTEVSIGLSDYLDGSSGQFIVVVEPARGFSLGEFDRFRDVVQTWVQVSQIGLDALVDNEEMLLWATDLKDGSPLSGVTIEAFPGRQSTTTGNAGLAQLNLPSGGVDFLVASSGADKAMLPRSTYVWGDDMWTARPQSDTLRWFVFDDRQMYRPNEEVHVKGWIRRVGAGKLGDIGPIGDQVTSVSYSVIGPQGNEQAQGQSDVNIFGGFDFVFSIPENSNLGYGEIILKANGNLSGLSGGQSYHRFQIQEFRRPEFEVTAQTETEGPYFVGGHAVASVRANYFAGGPLPNADVEWRVASSVGNYSPPNWPDFIFGEWIPWWFIHQPFSYETEFFDPFSPEFDDSRVETFSGVTDASGTDYLRLDFDEADKLRPFTVMAEASVTDVNRQSWASSTSMLVHPAKLYVGLRSASTFVERGTPLDIEIIVTDLDGNPVSDRPIEVQTGRLEWVFNQGAWREELADIQDCTLASSQEPQFCSFETVVGGEYQITAIVTDEAGFQNLSRFNRWVSGGQRPPNRDIERETVTLIPDKETYQPGDVAQILVQAPFSPAEGLMTVNRSGILYSQRFQIDDGTATLQVPIEDKHIPNLEIQVDVVGSAPRLDDQGNFLADAPPRPAFAGGQISLRIPPLRRTLSLEIDPEETDLEPGGETTINIRLTDSSGEPVAGAELAAVVVDEAILALTNYQLADPVSVFYLRRPSNVSSTYGRSSIILANPESLAEEVGSRAQEVLATQVFEEAASGAIEADMMAAAPAEGLGFADDEAPGSSSQPIRLRSDFNPLAVFEPEARTDRTGRAQIEVKLPDNLTRYRIMVVAVDSNNRFGSAETNLVARLPLMVRPSAPRFLNFGDQFELPVVLQNQTDEPLEVDVVVQASNLKLIDVAGKRVNVPANDRVEVRFPATTELPGTVQIQLAASSGDFADAALIDLPVYTPATTEAFATYGVVDEGSIAQPVLPPEDIFPQFGGLEIGTSSTALQSLTDAVLYLVSYPFESTEPIASRILGVAALRDVLAAFSADGLPSSEEMENAVRRDIEELSRLQNFDGGFPYWARGRDSIPYNTIHVAHALQKAKSKGYEVPENMQLMVLDYLRQIENHYPSWYGRRIRQTLSAYALYVRDLMGDTDLEKARRLFDDAGVDDLPLEATAWLWLVLNDDPGSRDQLEEIKRHVNNRAVETPSAANFTTSYADQAYLLLHSNRRTDALLLDALIAADPQNDLIPKVVNGLLAHKTRGRWSNTQENVFVLLALDRYFNTFEDQTPDFVAQMWLGDTYVGEHEFIGRTTDRRETLIPMSYLVDTDLEDGETQDLILSKDGDGRLYYRLGLKYAPSDLDLEPLDMGFVVQRSYEAVNDPEDVYQDEDGVWHIKAGAEVRVRLTMVAENRRYHVALTDPLPAGLEIVNPSLAVSGSIPQDPGSSESYYGWWWWWPWYEHQNMRDYRAEAFTSLLWDGVYDYSYVARATTPGVFIVPPAKAEEMYSPEVFGRSGSDLVIIES